MAATPYRPTSFTDKLLSVDKLNQMANNDQWLFENSPRVRYNYGNGAVVRDNGLKIIAGKFWFNAADIDWVTVPVYFGSFFNGACKPVVQATVEAWGRVDVTTAAIGGVGEIDNRGFQAHIVTQQPNGWTAINIPGGWLHWTATGF